jgi:hypothetical protein
MPLGGGASGRARDLIRTLRRTQLPYLEAQISSAGSGGIRTSIEEISKLSARENIFDSIKGFGNKLVSGRNPANTNASSLKPPNRFLNFPNAVRNSLDKNYVLTKTEMRDTILPPPGMPGSPMKVAPYQVSRKVEANSPSLFNQMRKQPDGPAETAFRERRRQLPLRGFEDYPAGFQNFMAKVLDTGNLAYRSKRAFELGVSDARESLLDMKTRAVAATLANLPGLTGDGLKALKVMSEMRHRSHRPGLEADLGHPLDTPIDHARAFGPGTYFAKNQHFSDSMFANFGANVYKPKTSIMESLKIAAGRGFLDIKDIEVPNLASLSWDDPIIQGFIRQGYIGLKHEDAYTTWLTGTNKGNRLQKVPPNKVFDETEYYAMGGLVKPKYFNYGGMVKKYAKGGDVVPSMLTPGEFVMSKYAVQNYGVDKMKAINSGTLKGDSVYNYEVNVSVQTDSNPDQIARAVLGQIKQIDAQRIRGNRF